MKLRERFERLIPDLSAALLRFPVAALFALLLCLYLNVDGINWSSDFTALAGAAAFFAAGAGHLFAEGRGLGRRANWLVAAALGLAAGLVVHFHDALRTSALLLFGGIVLILMIAAFLHARAAPAALWLFNLRLGLASLLAMIVGTVFGLGLSAIVEALNLLFDAGIPGDLHEHIWSIAVSLVGPLFGLSLMPRRLDEEVNIAAEKGTLLERGVSVLVNFVLVPIAGIYAAILHAYALKIAFLWELPKGQIGTMVTIYALGGTGAWLIAWPWRDVGTRALRWFMHGWFWLTAIPTVLLSIAIWRRLADYGVTPERYAVAVTAVWIAGLTLYLALRRNRADLRAILGGLAVLMLLGSAGPFGAYGLTISSQFERLSELLTVNGRLVDGRFVPSAAKLSQETGQVGNSMLHALREAGGLDRLKDWFEGAEKNPFTAASGEWDLTGQLAEVMGFQMAFQPVDAVNFYSSLPVETSVVGSSRLIGPIELATYKPTTAAAIAAEVSEGNLVVRANGKEWRSPIADVLAKAKAQLTGGAQAPVVYQMAPDLRLIFESMSGQLGDTPRFNSARLWIIVLETQG